jgi:hypothetical protein
MADVIEIDAATGAVISRDFTPEELAQREADALAAAEAQAALEVEIAEKESLRQSALDKLMALGLTEAEALALVGG